MQYHVSLPANWSPNKKWPILVTLDGSNSEFLHNNQTFAQARGSKPFIIVTPFIVSNTGKSTDYSKYNYSSAVWDEIKNEGTIRFDEQGVWKSSMKFSNTITVKKNSLLQVGQVAATLAGG